MINVTLIIVCCRTTKKKIDLWVGFAGLYLGLWLGSWVCVYGWVCSLGLFMDLWVGCIYGLWDLFYGFWLACEYMFTGF
jgi:hypothetical protein